MFDNGTEYLLSLIFLGMSSACSPLGVMAMQVNPTPSEETQQQETAVQVMR